MYSYCAKSRSGKTKRVRRPVLGICWVPGTFLVLGALLAAAGASAAGMPPLQPHDDPDAMIIHVSPAGDDGWSGRLAEANAERTDGPLATVVGARDRVRAVKAAADGLLNRPVLVLLREGVYSQSEPIVFTAEDSGTATCPVTYEAYPGEVPVISGGRRIRGWVPDDSAQSVERCEGRLMRTSVPDLEDGRPWRFNQLFVNGERRIRARLPNKGDFLRTDGPVSSNDARSFYFREGDLRSWDRLREAIVVVYHSWETSIHHIRTLDEEASRVTFWERAPWPMGRWEKHQRYYVENVFEALDQPGEWYLDRADRTLYYYPLPDERMGEAEVVAPVLTTTLIEFDGDAATDQTIEYMRFRGIAFRHTNAKLNRIRNPGQGEIYQAAMIMAKGLRHSLFESCEVAHAGAHAIWMADGSSDTIVRQCHLVDLGGGGVYIGGGWGVQDQTPAERITVDNCFIHDGGHLFHGAHGVWIGRSSYNSITHNEISNFDYSGISCGWSWGFQPSSAHHNKLEYNYIHHLSNGEGLSDMGGIYTLGISPGTTERHNHIHDIYSYAHVSHGSGIYPDEGSSEILIENNVVYRVRTCPLFQHYGGDNTVTNNIFAFGGRGQMQRCREDKRCHFAAVGNIVYADIPEMLGGVWRNGDWDVGRNLYWSTAGEPTFRGMDFTTWQEHADDEGSRVADPHFVDPQAGDFRLQEGSPAFDLGFTPIDVSESGLYGAPAWTAMPEAYPNRPLNDIPAPVVPPFIVNLGFESGQPGKAPLDGKIVPGSNGAAVTVSTEQAATGSRSLKFVDAPDQQYSWTPHIYYHPEYDEGEIEFSWDLFNSSAKPASFYLEVRQWDVRPYRVGPTVSVSADGTVTSGDTQIGKVPLGTWAHVDARLSLGTAAPKTFTVTLTPAGGTPVTARVPFFQDSFERITWIGVSSTSDAESVFYIDNLRLGTQEDLAKPVKRRPLLTAARVTGPLEPPRADQCVARWTFDESEGYLAEDSSGCQNHGDVWTMWAEGPFGSAIFCDPAASSVIVPDSPTLRFGTSDFTVAMWLCPTRLDIESSDKRRRFFSKDNFPHTWWNLNITPAGKVVAEMVDAEKNRFSLSSEGAVPEKVWTHVTLVMDRANREARLFFNGALDSAKPIPAAFGAALDVEGSDVTIGSSWQSFIGLIDEVSLYKRALDADDISSRVERARKQYTSAEFEIVE